MKEKIIESLKKGLTGDQDFKLIKFEKEEVILEYNVKESGLNPYGMVHGGTIFALADTASGVLSLLSGRLSVTTSSSINFINAAKCKKLIAKAKVLEEKNKIGYYEVNVYDENEKLISTCLSNMYFLDK